MTPVCTVKHLFSYSGSTVSIFFFLHHQTKPKKEMCSKIKSRKEIKDKRRWPNFQEKVLLLLKLLPSCCNFLSPSSLEQNLPLQKKNPKQTQKGESVCCAVGFVFTHVAQRSPCHSASCVARALKRSQTSLMRRVNPTQSSTGAAPSDAGIVVSFFFFLKCAVEILKAALRL